jgi:hypothetical protein
MQQMQPPQMQQSIVRALAGQGQGVLAKLRAAAAAAVSSPLDNIGTMRSSASLIKATAPKASKPPRGISLDILDLENVTAFHARRIGKRRTAVSHDRSRGDSMSGMLCTSCSWLKSLS